VCGSTGTNNDDLSSDVDSTTEDTSFESESAFVHHSDVVEQNASVLADKPASRSESEIRHNDIVSFITAVRKLSCQTINIERNMRQIKNMSNVIFRHYVGYTAKAEYRLKFRNERCFSDDIERCGLDDPFGYVQGVSSSDDVARPIDPADVAEPLGSADVAEPIDPADVAPFVEPLDSEMTDHVSFIGDKQNHSIEFDGTFEFESLPCNKSANEDNVSKPGNDFEPANASKPGNDCIPEQAFDSETEEESPVDSLQYGLAFDPDGSLIQDDDEQSVSEDGNLEEDGNKET